MSKVSSGSRSGACMAGRSGRAARAPTTARSSLRTYSDVPPAAPPAPPAHTHSTALLARTTTDRLIRFSLVDAILYTCIVIHIKAEDFCHMAEIITHARRQSKRALRYQATVYLASSRVIFEQVTTIREYNLVI